MRFQWLALAAVLIGCGTAPAQDEACPVPVEDRGFPINESVEPFGLCTTDTHVGSNYVSESRGRWRCAPSTTCQFVGGRSAYGMCVLGCDSSGPPCPNGSVCQGGGCKLTCGRSGAGTVCGEGRHCYEPTDGGVAFCTTNTCD
jgi:hypothetical protein